MGGATRDVWLRYKGKGKHRRPDSWYHLRLRLRTKDAIVARERARLAQAGKWPPIAEQAAEVTAAAFAIPTPAPTPAPAPAADPPPAPAAIPVVTGDWTHASTAAAADTIPSAEIPAPEPQISSEQLAEFLVTVELNIAQAYTRNKFYSGFEPAPMPPDGRKVLVDAYRSILDYGGAALALPPWLDSLIKGVIFPGVTLVMSSMAIVGGYRDLALEQKRTAEGGG